MEDSIKYEISFIIPVFNGQDTIVRCLESIYSSGLSTSRFQVIVIDDCSTDNTAAIVNEFALNHANLTLLHQPKNHRQGAARNLGIKTAQGAYIMFVDADDIVEAEISDALEKAFSLRVDMLWCQWRRQVKPNGEFEVVKSTMDYDAIIKGLDFCERYYDMMIYGGPCTYLYKSSFLNSLNIAFVEDRRMEDVDWVEKHLFYCQQIACCRAIVYSYFYNEGSTLHSFSAERDADTIMYCIRRLQFADKVESLAGLFSNKVKEYSFGWINYVFSFRHMTRHNAGSLYSLYRNLEKGSLSYLRKYHWKFYTRFCITYPLLTSILMTFISPIASMARFIHHKIS